VGVPGLRTLSGDEGREVSVPTDDKKKSCRARNCPTFDDR
jgi:hypothetical protein